VRPIEEHGLCKKHNGCVWEKKTEFCYDDVLVRGKKKKETKKEKERNLLVIDNVSVEKHITGTRALRPITDFVAYPGSIEQHANCPLDDRLNQIFAIWSSVE
jgi:hypothetical protein